MQQGVHLQEAIQAARSGYRDLARFHCQQAAQECPEDPQIWMLMAWLAETPLAMVECLQRCVDNEALTDTAQAGLTFAQSMCHSLAAPPQSDNNTDDALVASQPAITTDEDALATDSEIEPTQPATPGVTDDAATDSDDTPDAPTTGFVLVRSPETDASKPTPEETSETTDHSDSPIIDLEHKDTDASPDAEIASDPAELPEEKEQVEPAAVHLDDSVDAAQLMSGELLEAPDDGDMVPTILVVDDSPTVRKMAQMTLESRGFRVVTAFDGVAAIKEIARHEPWLILLDINMPRLDGYQLCSLVRKHKRTQHIPVVMLSGKDGMFDKLRGKMAGCSTYMTKPFVPEKLIEVVDRYIGQSAITS